MMVFSLVYIYQIFEETFARIFRYRMFLRNSLFQSIRCHIVQESIRFNQRLQNFSLTYSYAAVKNLVLQCAYVPCRRVRYMQNIQGVCLVVRFDSEYCDFLYSPSLP